MILGASRYARQTQVDIGSVQYTYDLVALCGMTLYGTEMLEAYAEYQPIYLSIYLSIY